MQAKPANNFDVISEGFDFLEAPRISPEGDVWFADLTGKGVYRKREGGAVETMLPDRQWVGGMVFDESGLVLCGGRGGIVALDPKTGETYEILSEIEGEPIIAVNDIEGDGFGGFYAGTIDFVSIMETDETPKPGLFFHCDPDRRVTVLRRDVSASNGIAVSPCGRWLYHSETSQGIWRHPLTPDGLPGAGELIVELEDSDGLVADSQGNLWVACWNTGRLLQFSAEGSCIVALAFPYPHIVSLTFGSADPSSLYVATGGSSDVPNGGAILRIEVDVPGLPGELTRLTDGEQRLTC